MAQSPSLGAIAGGAAWTQSPLCPAHGTKQVKRHAEKCTIKSTIESTIKRAIKSTIQGTTTHAYSCTNVNNGYMAQSPFLGAIAGGAA